MASYLSEIQYYEATRYLSAVALTVSLWDHFLNFSKEVDLVWRRPESWSALQAIVMINRYGEEIGVFFIAYVLSNFRPAIEDSTCHGFVVVVVIYGILCSALSQFALLLRAYSLWDNRKTIRHALVGGFVVCFSISMALSVCVARIAFGQLQYSRLFNICMISPNATDQSLTYYSLGAWGAMLLYDIYVVFILIANAMNRPRRHDSEIIKNLSRDGTFTLLAFSGLRFIQFLPSVFGKVSIIFLTPVIAWSLDSVLSFRLFLRMKAIEIQDKQQWENVTTQSAPILDVVEMSWIDMTTSR